MRTLGACIAAAVLSAATVPALAGPLFPPGAPASTMKPLSEIDSSVSISSLPFSITSPGTYKLSSSLVCPNGETGIFVDSTDVTIDLNGFSLSGSPSSLSGIFISSDSSRVCVSNGSVLSFGGAGIDAPGATDVCLDTLTIERCGSHGVRMSSGTLRDVSSSFNDGWGMLFAGDLRAGTDVYVWKVKRVCVVSSNGLGGVSVVSSCDVELDGLSVTSNMGPGISSSAAQPEQVSDLYISNTRCVSNEGDGLRVTGAPSLKPIRLELSRCDFSSNTGNGVTIDGVGAVFDLSASSSSLTDNGGSGMAVTARGSGGAGGGGGGAGKVSFSDLSFTRNGVHGFLSSPSSLHTAHFDRCSFEENTQHGASCADGNNYFLYCDLSRNQGSGLHSSGGTLGGEVSLSVSSSRCDNNGGSGIDCPLDEGSVSLSLHSSSCDGNGGSGVSLVTTSGSGAGGRVSVTCSSSSCSSNNGNGIHIDPGTASGMRPDFSVLLGGSGMTTDNNKLNGVLFRSSGGQKASVCYNSSRSNKSSLRGMDIDCDDADIRDVELRGNTGGGLLCGTTDHFLISGVTSVGNGGNGIEITGGNFGSVERCVTSSNTGDGLVCGTTDHLSVEDVSSSSNTGRGLAVDCDLGYVRQCRVSGNGGGGLQVTGDLVLVSGNSVSGHTSSSGIPSFGIQIDGTGCHVTGNFVSGNDRGVHMLSGTNSLYENKGSGNTNPLFEESGATTDSSPFSSAASAQSPVSNIGFQP